MSHAPLTITTTSSLLRSFRWALPFGALGLALGVGLSLGQGAVAQDQANAAGPVASPPPSLEAILKPITEDRLFIDAAVGVQVVDVASGQEVFSWKADDKLMPASTMKVLTSSVALRELGPAFRYKTALLTDAKAELDNKGVLGGNLYIKGSGDPTLVIEKLWKLVYDLKMEGVTEVSGDVVFDDTYMDKERLIPGWDKKADIEDGPTYFSTLGALSLNYNAAALVVGPGPEVGGAARAQLEVPSAAIVEVENKLTTTTKGSRRNIRMEREVEGRTMKLTLTGTVPLGGDVERFYRVVPDPTAYFVACFAELLKAHGIKVKGQWREAETPDKVRELASLRSAPLSVILMDVNKNSNNFFAEQVLKTVGAEVKGAPGSTAKGLEVIADYLKELGVAPGEYTAVNGSGLSRGTKFTAAQLNAALVDMAMNEDVTHEFRSSLAIGGRDGTLWSRFRDSDEVDRVRAKTGTLDGVHCLSGYALGQDGRLYAFTFFVNDLPYSISRARKVQDQLVSALFTAGGDVLAEQAP